MLSGNTNNQSKSTLPQARQPTRSARPTIIISPSLEIFPPSYTILSSSWTIIKLHSSPLTRSESVQMNSKQNDVLSMSPSLETSKQFSDIHYSLKTTKEILKTTFYHHNSRNLNTLALSSSRTQTFPRSIRKTQVSESVIAFTEPFKQTYAHQHTSIKSQSY